MKEVFIYQKGRFRVTEEVDPDYYAPPPPPPPESSSRTDFTPRPPTSSGLPPRLPDSRQRSSARPPRLPDWQQPSSSRQPDHPQNADQNLPDADAPRLSQKRKQSPGQLAGEGEHNLAPPVTQTPPAEDSLGLTEKRKKSTELSRKEVQEQRPSFVQTPQPEQQQQPAILHHPEPQQQRQSSPFPSFVQQPAIFQTLQPEQQQQPVILDLLQPQQQQQFSPFASFAQQPAIFQTLQPEQQQQQPAILDRPQPQQQQQFSSLPSFIQQCSPFSPLIFQSHPQMAFAFSTPQLQQQLPSLFQTLQPQQQKQPSIFQTAQPQRQQQPSIFQTPQPQQQPSIFQPPHPQQQQQQPSIFQIPQPQQQQQFSQFPSFGQQPQQQNVQFQQQQAPQSQQQAPQSQQQAPPPQQQQAPPPQQQLMLFTADGSPTSNNTKFVDLHPDSQKLLLQIEERIQEYRAESERLDQCFRLYDSSVSSDHFELDASRILQELGGITTAIEREKFSVQDLMKKVNDMMWHTEFAVRSYMMLRPRFLRPNVPAASGIGSASQTVGAAGTSGQTNQLMTSSISPSFEFYSGIPKRPSQFMHHTAARFKEYLTECCRWIEELEQLVLMDTDKTSSKSLEALPRVMTNVYDYFIHVATKVENLHQYVKSMKMAYLADHQRRGDGNDPFLEANRREAAKQESAARRVHPTSHLLANYSRPVTQAAGIFASSTASISSAPQLSSGTTAASSASSSFLFLTPTASAQSSSLFGSAGFTPQSTPFGTASTSLFGSTRAPSGFGINTASFSSTPAVGSSPLFTTPSFGTGAATGSGASFGAASKSSRPESHSTRH